MPPIRVLVVDDAVVFRRLISDELGKTPGLAVAGTAANGKIALAKIPQVNPDVVLLDVEMPEMDGLEALTEIRKAYPKLPVIMFSALTQRGAEATLDALARGATDYFAKPAGNNLADSLRVIREQLVPQIRALVAPRRAAAAPPTAPSGELRLVPPGPPRVVAIGCSTGGPNALADVFARFPTDLPVPVVIVQHMPPMFTKLLADRLTAQFKIPVREAAPGDVLRAPGAWIAPGDHHMTVERAGDRVVVGTNQDPPENSCRPAVDVLFRSVARAFGPAALGVVLTGMGQDGLRGCQVLREAGATILAQDEASSVVWGMPGYVAQAGLAARVLPLAMMGDEIVRRVRAAPAGVDG